MNREYVILLADAIAARATGAFDTWTQIYITPGGTLVVAASGNSTDSGSPRDLLAVLPGDLGQGLVVPLNITVNPDLVEGLEHELAARQATDGGDRL